MAVFTPVSRDALDRWIGRFDLGRVTGFEGIAEGIENTNYFVDTERGRFVLTIFERLPAGHLPFHLGLMHHLAARRIPCPDPVADRDGRTLGALEGKPAALVTRLPGRAVAAPRREHCAEVGALVARMHLAAADYPGTMVNPRGLDWWRAVVPQLERLVGTAQAGLMRDELAAQQAFAGTANELALPRAAVHADLFRDNVLFDDGRVGGVIDFWFAATDRLLFDLAVTCNDWCTDDTTGEFDRGRLAALLDGYRRLRPLSDAERAAWPTMLRAAAFRFWMSRLFDYHLPRPAEIVTPKDPAHFERVLRSRRAGVPSLS